MRRRANPKQPTNGRRLRQTTLDSLQRLKSPANQHNKKNDTEEMAFATSQPSGDVESMKSTGDDSDNNEDNDSDVDDKNGRPKGTRLNAGRRQPSRSSQTKQRSTVQGNRRSSPRKRNATSSDDEGDHSQNDDEEDESDDEDFKPSKTLRQTSKKRSLSIEEDDDDDDEDHGHILDSDDDDDEIQTNPRKQRTTWQNTTTTSTTRRGRRSTKTVSKNKNKNTLDDFIVDDDESIEEDQPMMMSSAKGTPRGRRDQRSTTKSRTVVVKEDNSTEDDSNVFDEKSDDDDDDDGGPRISRGTPKRTASIRTARLTSRTKATRPEDSSSEELEVRPSVSSSVKKPIPPSPASARPRRSSASRALQQLQQHKESSEDDDDDDDDEVPSPQRRKSPRKSQILSSDEEFLADSASEASNEKEIEYTGSEDQSTDSIVRSGADQASQPVNVDSDGIGSADESSGDDQRHKDTGNGRTRKGGRWDEIQPSPARPLRSRNNYDSSDDDDNGDDGAGSSQFQCIPCTNTEDAITLEVLPRIHVCYLSPDGNSRQCFAIETLRQIALKSSHGASRIDIDGSQQDTYLQPPHFRTPMNADLLDQIASRFGRDALNLHGPFFTRKAFNHPGALDSDKYHAIFGQSRLDYGEHFEERVTKYITGMMGSRDVYCCCLCYSEMHRRIVHLDGKRRGGGDRDEGSQSSDDEEFLKLAPDSKYDPMTVLGWLDNDKYAAASCFCFSKVASLKRHLRDDHGVQTKGITGNDLYQRYRVRGTDGLLQRYLHNHRKRSYHATFQGSMQRYWFDGANQSFVCLLEMMDRAEAFRAILDDRNIEDDLREKADAFFEQGKSFFESFQNRAEIEWEQISSPFHKNSQQDDVDDFIANDDESDDVIEEEYPNFLTHRRLQEEDDSDQNDLVHKLQRKYGSANPQHSSDDDDDDEEDDEDDDVSVSSILDHKGYYSEEEVEEKDEWVASIQKKRRKPLNSDGNPPLSAESKRQKETPRGKKIVRKKHLTPSSASPASLHSSTTTPASKRRAIQESSSEEEFG